MSTYMYRKRRLRMLKKDSSSNSHASYSCESGSEAEICTQTMHTSISSFKASSASSYSLGTNFLTSIEAKTKNLQGFNKACPVAKISDPISAAIKQMDYMSEKINSKNSQCTDNIVKSWTMFMTKNSAIKKRKAQNLINEQHTLNMSNSLVKKSEACNLCSSLVPCADSNINRQDLIYHLPSTRPPDCVHIFDAYYSLLLKNVELFGADLTVCAECMKSFSVPSDLLKHLYTHAIIKSRSKMEETAIDTSAATLLSPAKQAESKASNHAALADSRKKSAAQLSVQAQEVLVPVENEIDFIRNKTDTKLAVIPKCKLKNDGKTKSLCQFCGGLYLSLRDHINKVHMKCYPYVCSRCQKRFSQKKEMEKHKSNHPLYYCKVCQKYLKQKWFFKAHMRFHESNMKPFKCDQCDKSFMSKHNLKAHQVLHTGRKPFQCSYCSKGYMAKGHFEAHMNSHYGVKEHKCPVCFQEFFSRCRMLDHMRSHNKCHLCEQCGKAFESTSKLKRHFVRMHQNNRQQTRKNKAKVLHSEALSEDVLTS